MGCCCHMSSSFQSCCHHMSIIFLFPFVLFFVSFSCRIPVNTGFNHNCCHCFLSQHKRNILLFFALFTLFLSLCKVPKASFYKVLKEKMKHKKDEKEEEDCLYVYTRKKHKKHCSIHYLKKLETPIL